MNKKNLKAALIVIPASLVVYLLMRPAEDAWYRFANFVNPFGYNEYMEHAWRKKNTDFLINHLGTYNNGAATHLLALRKDLLREQKLIEIVTSNRDIKSRSSALGVLFAWDEEKAEGLAMEFVKAGRSHPMHYYALLYLARVKYAPAFQYLIEFSKQPDGYRNGSVNMLADYGKVEGIQVLAGMLTQTNIPNSALSGFYRTTIQDAIKSIKEKNGLS